MAGERGRGLGAARWYPRRLPSPAPPAPPASGSAGPRRPARLSRAPPAIAPPPAVALAQPLHPGLAVTAVASRPSLPLPIGMPKKHLGEALSPPAKAVSPWDTVFAFQDGCIFGSEKGFPGEGKAPLAGASSVPTRRAWLHCHTCASRVCVVGWGLFPHLPRSVLPPF